MGLFLKINHATSQLIKGFDVFSKTITLTYKGNDKYQTIIGGLSSIFLFGVTLGFLIDLITRLHNREFSTTTVNDSYIYGVDEVINFSENDVTLIFYSFLGYEYLSNTSLFQKIEFTTYELNIDSKGTYTIENRISTNAVRWNESKVNYDNFGVYDNLAALICPESTENLTIQGNQGNSLSQGNLKVVGLDIYYWNHDENETWATKEELSYLLNNYGSFILFYYTSYFDSYSYDNPIKQGVISSHLQDSFKLNQTKYYDIFVSKDIVETQDSYFSIFENPKKYNFISFDNLQTGLNLFPDKPNLLMSTSFKMAEKSTYYTRTTYGYLDVIGIAGGLYSILKAFIGLIIGPIVQLLYDYDMNHDANPVDIENIEKATETTDRESEFTKNASTKQNQQLNENVDQETIRNSNREVIYRVEESNTSRELESEFNNRAIIAESISSRMVNKRLLNYSWLDFFYSFGCRWYGFSCWINRRKNVKLKSILKMYDRFKSFEQGWNALNKELDVRNIYKANRYLSNFISVWLSDEIHSVLQNNWGNSSSLISDSTIQIPNLLRESIEKIKKYKEDVGKLLLPFYDKSMEYEDLIKIQKIVWKDTPIEKSNQENRKSFLLNNFILESPRASNAVIHREISTSNPKGNAAFDAINQTEREQISYEDSFRIDIEEIKGYD